MFKRTKILLALTVISLTTTFVSSANAENVTDVNSFAEEDVTLTGESLQGIEGQNINQNSSNSATRMTEVTIEREKPQNTIETGNEFIDSMINRQAQPKTPTVEEGLSKNQGDRNDSSGGTVPLFNF